MKDKNAIVTFYAAGSNTVVPAALADCVPFYGIAQDRKTRIVAGFIKAGERFSSVADPKWPEGGEDLIRKIREFECRSAEELMLKIDAKGLGETVPDPPQTPAGVRALAAENRKLKDKIAKMREMLK